MTLKNKYFLASGVVTSFVIIFSSFKYYGLNNHNKKITNQDNWIFCMLK